MKKIISFLFFGFCSFYAYCQNNPYAIFGSASKISERDLKQNPFKIKNNAPNSKVKYLEFDFKNHQVKLLDTDGSLIRRINIDNGQVFRWLSPDAKASKFPGFSPYNFVENNPIISIDPDGDEKIVLTGGADLHNKNRMNFIMASKTELKNYRNAVKKAGSGEKVSWLIFDLDYTDKEKKSFTTWAKANGVSAPIFVNDAKEVVNYINSQTTRSQNLSEARKADQVSDLSAFSHGVPSFVRFGYENNGVDINKYDKTDFGIREGLNLLRGAFAPRNEIDLFSCNAATPFQNLKQDFVSRTLLIKSSLSLPNLVTTLSTVTGGTVSGLIGRSDYSVVGNGVLPAQGQTGGDYSPTVQGQAIPAIKVTSTNGKSTTSN